MPRIRKCLIQSQNQHGNIRYQFQRGSRGPKFVIHGQPNDPDFEHRYNELLAGADAVEAYERGRKQRIVPTGVPETVSELIQHHERYMAKQVANNEFAEATRDHYARLLQKVETLIGQVNVGSIETHQLRRFIETQTTTSNSFNNMLRAIKNLFKFGAAFFGLNNPASELSKRRITTDGFLAWSDDDLERYFSIHKKGSKAYLAMMLLLHASPRRQDLVQLGPKNIVQRNSGAAIRFKPQKTARGSGVTVEVPLHLDLLDAIAAMGAKTDTFLARQDGHPYTPETLGNYIRDWRQEAGINSKVSAHGIRHTRGKDLAENSATEYEIMAVLGHTTTKASLRYTKDARRRQQALNGTKKTALFDRVSDWTGDAD